MEDLNDKKNSKFITSSISTQLDFLNSTSFEKLSELTVTTLGGLTQNNIFDLQYDVNSNYIFANIWYSNKIILIHSITGVVEYELDLGDIVVDHLNSEKMQGILNGITLVSLESCGRSSSSSSNSQQFCVAITGQNWDSFYLLYVYPEESCECSIFPSDEEVQQAYDECEVHGNVIID